MLTMLNDIETWQCVIEKIRESWDENRGKVKTTSYLVGESTDNGLTWKFIDASHNSLVNVIYIMPSVFSKLEIPESSVIYVDEVATQKQPRPNKQPRPPQQKRNLQLKID